MKLYRAVSQNEKSNYEQFHEFRTGRNTLEAKQFFKSRIAAINFVGRSVLQNYDPSYQYLLIIDMDDDCLNAHTHTNINLDGYDAISVEEDDLANFNICVRFVNEEIL
jgi:hypothetical protein